MTKQEFERLKPGQIIQNKKNNEWAFIVHQNFGDRLTAVRTIEVREPNDWEAVTEVKMEEKPDPKLIDVAAHNLHEKLKGNAWYQMVGIGDNELIIYTAKKKHDKPFENFEGYRVSYHHMGKIAPLVSVS